MELEYIQFCIKHTNDNQKSKPKKNIINKLQWTADKINLVELIYALFFANCINNGNVKIKEITELFEEVFSIKLGEYYRSFVEIKRRKLIRGKFTKILFNLVEENITKLD